MIFSVISLFNIFVLAESYDHAITRGVDVKKASLYDALKDFTCLDGTITLPFSYVNDDYCDCLDGSDEPGTPACPNGVFYCINNGYIPINIPTSRVNDGICDCCDASDEYATGNCTNSCAILGAEAKQRAEKLAELMVKGNQLMLELSAAGKQLKREKKDRIRTLELEKAEAERLRNEAEQIKVSTETTENAALQEYRALEEAERAEQIEKEKAEADEEAANVFKHLDSNSDMKLQAEEIKSRQTFDQDKNGEVSEEELKFFMDSKEVITWEEFKEVSWPRMKPFYMREKGLFTPPDPKDDEAEEEEEVDYENGNEGSDNEEENWERTSETEEDQKEEDNEERIEPETPKYDENTQKLIEEANTARSQYEAADRAVQDLERELSQLRESLLKNYGEEEEFSPLDGQCFTYSDREYTYKLCPFDQVVQMAKSGGSETRLGVWKSWATEGDYSIMVYDKGQSCWNGPQRSAKVLVSCGLENTVVGAAEPNKCEYVLDFKTPAACRLQERNTSDSHDEL